MPNPKSDECKNCMADSVCSPGVWPGDEACKLFKQKLAIIQKVQAEQSITKKDGDNGK